VRSIHNPYTPKLCKRMNRNTFLQTICQWYFGSSDVTTLRTGFWCNDGWLSCTSGLDRICTGSADDTSAKRKEELPIRFGAILAWNIKLTLYKHNQTKFFKKIFIENTSSQHILILLMFETCFLYFRIGDKKQLFLHIFYTKINTSMCVSSNFRNLEWYTSKIYNFIYK